MITRKVTFIVLALLMLSSLTSSVFASTLSYPTEGEIPEGAGGSLWNAWDAKEDAVPYFMSLADSYGGSYESIGNSSGDNDWDIVLFKFGNPNGGTVMIESYLHGNEYYGYQVLKSLITWLVTSNDSYAKRILANNYVLVVPVANYRWGRTNYNVPEWMTTIDPAKDGDNCGVNLNRNFAPSWDINLSISDGDDYSGVSADCEVECQALINAWDTYNPLIYWSLHQGIGPYTRCAAKCNQAITVASKVKSLLPEIQTRLGIVEGWSFNVYNSTGRGYSRDGAASRGSVGFITEVMSGWDATESKKADLESGETFNQMKTMFIAMCQAVDGTFSISSSGSDQTSTDSRTSIPLDSSSTQPSITSQTSSYSYSRYSSSRTSYSRYSSSRTSYSRHRSRR